MSVTLDSTLDLSRYQPAHRARLEELVGSPAWRVVLDDPRHLDELRAGTLRAPSAPGQLRGALNALQERNATTIQDRIQAGERDVPTLTGALGNWEASLAAPEPWPFYFLGLVLTIECQFVPRCLYCNQLMLPRRLTLDDWKRVVAEAATPVPPYVYLTGGEPLLLGKEVWGDDGLVAYATGLGCAVNLNTNAALITPRVALQLVKSGLARIHISLDSADPETAGILFGGRDRVEAVWRGILNVQLARQALGVTHPQIHINCVLTRLNLFQFPDLLHALLALRARPEPAPGRRLTADPSWGDFAFHLIPVGGRENDAIRPTAEEWQRFYTETWDEAERVWADYQVEIGVPEAERKALSAHVPFANPYKRVDHHLSLDEYCLEAAGGTYWQGALSEHCYVAPSQAYVLPDGSQHWCGAHAVRRPEPLGNVLERPLRENIRRRLARLEALPGPNCVNCAGATCVINQTMERNLRAQVTSWLAPQAAA